MIDYFKRGWSKYAEFSGRDTRPQFWYFYLGNVIVSLILYLIFTTTVVGAMNGNPGLLFYISMGLLSLFSLAAVLPTLGAIVRRLHDVGKSGWFFLLSFIPLIGVIILIVFLASKGEDGANKYGPDPRGGDSMIEDSLLTV